MQEIKTKDFENQTEETAQIPAGAPPYSAPQDAADGSPETLTQEDFKKIVENLLFITERPLSLAKLSQTAEINNLEQTREIVSAIQREYAQTGRAVQIVELGGGFQMATKPEYGRWVRKLFNERTAAKLSPAAMETLAIIAYKQPVTKAEVEVIRGVDITAPLEKLLERGLVRIAGKKDAPGRPMVFATTEEFLRLFGLNKVSELPEMQTYSIKGPREVQSDLPFSENLPPADDAILPITDEDETPILPASGQSAAQNEQEEEEK
jgi:segregation and condensation protein B